MADAELKTEVILRPIKVENALTIFKLSDINRTYLAEWLPWVVHTTKVTDTTQFIKDAIRKMRDRTLFTAEIWYYNEIVGVIDLHGISSIDKKAYIGYWLSQQAMGKGIVTRAVKTLIDYGFNEYNLNRIVIDIASTNFKSRAIPERLNLKEEGTLREDINVNGVLMDRVIYAILRSEWLEQQTT